eukprot:Rhum_TRINITY_DN14614_c4_g2::Rhum_TRINITY_DN14614_c4_g2_i1::g.104251::m.104251
MDDGVGRCALLGYREERCVLAGDATSVRVAAVSWRVSRGSLRPPTDADIEMLSRAVQAPAPPDVVVVAISACQRVGADWKASVWKAVVGALEGGAVYKETASVEKGGSYLVVFTLAPSAVTPHSVVVGGFEALGRHSTAALVSCGEQGGTFCFANWAFPRRTNRHEEREQAYYTFLGETYRCLGLRNTGTPSFPLSLLSKTPASLQHSSKVWVSSGVRGEGAAGLGSLLHDGARLLSSCDYLFVAGALESRLCDGRDQLARSMQRRRCFAPHFVDLEPASAPGALTSYLDAAKTFPGDPAPPLKPGVAGGRCTRVLLHAAFSRDALAPPSSEEAGGCGAGAPAPGGSVLPPTAPRVLACKVVPFGRVKDRPLAALVDVVVLRAGAAAGGQEAAEAALLRRVAGVGASLPVLEADEAVARRGCVLVETSERATLRELSLLLAGWAGVAAGQARRRALRLLQLSGADAPPEGAAPEACDEDAASSEDSVSDDDDDDDDVDCESSSSTRERPVYPPAAEDAGSTAELRGSRERPPADGVRGRTTRPPSGDGPRAAPVKVDDGARKRPGAPPPPPTAGGSRGVVGGVEALLWSAEVMAEEREELRPVRAATSSCLSSSSVCSRCTSRFTFATSACATCARSSSSSMRLSSAVIDLFSCCSTCAWCSFSRRSCCVDDHFSSHVRVIWSRSFWLCSSFCCRATSAPLYSCSWRNVISLLSCCTIFFVEPSLIVALFTMRFAWSAYFSVLSDSSRSAADDETVASITVFELPPRDSRSSHVSAESR